LARCTSSPQNKNISHRLFDRSSRCANIYSARLAKPTHGIDVHDGNTLFLTKSLNFFGQTLVGIFGQVNFFYQTGGMGY